MYISDSRVWEEVGSDKFKLTIPAGETESMFEICQGLALGELDMICCRKIKSHETVLNDEERGLIIIFTVEGKKIGDSYAW